MTTMFILYILQKYYCNIRYIFFKGVLLFIISGPKLSEVLPSLYRFVCLQYCYY